MKTNKSISFFNDLKNKNNSKKEILENSTYNKTKEKIIIRLLKQKNLGRNNLFLNRDKKNTKEISKYNFRKEKSSFIKIIPKLNKNNSKTFSISHSLNNSCENKSEIILKNSNIKINYINFKDRIRMKQEGKTLTKKFDNMTSIDKISFEEDDSKFKFIQKKIALAINKFKSKNKKFYLSDICLKNLSDINPNKKNLSFSINNKPSTEKFIKNVNNIAYERRFEDCLIKIKKNSIKNNLYDNLIKLKGKNNQEIIKIIRLETLRWLWINNALILEKLIAFFIQFKWYFDKIEYINKDNFIEFANVSNLYLPRKIIDQLFKIFSFENSKDLVDIKVMQAFIVLTSHNSSFQEKIILLLNLFESGNDNTVNFMKLIIIFENLFCNDFNKNLLNKFYKEVSLKYSEINFKNNIMILLKNSNKNKIIDIRNKNLNIILMKEINRKKLEYELLNSKIISYLYKNFFNFYIKIKNELNERLSNLLNFNSDSSLCLTSKRGVNKYDCLYYSSLGNILILHDKYSSYKDKINNEDFYQKNF